MGRRGWLLTGLGLVVVVVLLLLAPTPQPPWSITSTAADGTDMLRRILDQEFDVEVVQAGPMASIDDLTTDDLVVVFEDRLEPADGQAITDHVGAGGRAIVAVPGAAGVAVEAGGGLRALAGAPNCDLLPGTRIGPRPGRYDETALAVEHRPLVVPDDATTSCWEEDGTAYLVELADPSGGALIRLASPVGVSNGMLANRSGTTQLVALFVPPSGGRMLVVQGDGAPTPGDLAPEGALPDRLVWSMWLLVLAGGLYVLANVRRLGPVLTEEPVVRVPAAELALGVADLLQRHGHAEHAAAHVRAGLRADLDRVLGTSGADDADVVALVSRATGLDAEVVRRATAGNPVGDDGELIEVVDAANLVRANLGLSPHAVDSLTHDQRPRR